ncbi:Pentatricopeptide repeat-containing protein [Platanthera zijinensis]|uniref:Pentatricopeptide repeat-containing protein n=1 Tax=Platanthera zijinensis TaxID=2320716 RepID=A0AAP0AT66_9ASPA
MLDHCTTMKDFKQIHSQILRSGLASFLPEHRRMLSFCCSPGHGDMSYARLLFDAMPDPDNFIWNTMIKGYSASILPESAASFYIEMLTRGITPDHYTYPFLLRSGMAIEFIDQIHAHVIKFGFRSNPYVLDALIHVYSFGGAMDAARELFDTSSKRNAVSWNAMISAYNRRGDISTAWNLFERMETKDVITWTAMVSGFARIGQVDDARELFDRMPERDIISWTAMIDGYIKGSRFKEVLGIFRELQAAGEMPDEFTIASVLTACANLGALDIGNG